MILWYVANIQRYKLAQVHRLSEYCDNTSATTLNPETFVLHNILHYINSINLHVNLKVSNHIFGESMIKHIN